MYRTALLIASTLIIALSAFRASAEDNARIFSFISSYEVTITNITSNQVFSPPILVSHRSGISLFELGEAASDELALMAEDGDTSSLAAVLAQQADVNDIVLADGPILPGGSASYQIPVSFSASQISVAGMLVNTNDTFFAINGVDLPPGRRAGGTRTYLAVGYDAGSEENNEDCGFIPGPACDGAGAGVRAPENAEGFIHVSDGIHGILDIAPDRYDWRNPVARITVKAR
jgi:hypothetical protein